MSDRRYSTSRWQRTRRQVLQRDGYACQIEGPNCTGRATSAHHIRPSSQDPDSFFDFNNLVAACTACNSGGGRKIAVANQRANVLRLQQQVEQLNQRVLVLAAKVAQLEEANGHPEPLAHPKPRIY